MHDSSRMLQRVRHGYFGSRLNIPRKGRIRVVLLLVGIAVVARMAGHRTHKNSPVSKPAKPPVTATASRPVTTKPAGPVLPALTCTERRRSSRPEVSPVEAPKPQQHRGFTFALFGKAPTPKPAGHGPGPLLGNHSPEFNAAVDTVRTGSHLRVAHYSIDTTLQQHALHLMRQYRPRYGAAVVVEPATGRVLTLVSFTNDTVPAIGNRLYCRSMFPAASVFKTVTAAAAMEIANLGPESTLRQVGRNHTLYKFQLEKDLEVSRDITLTEAYAYSVNPVFARIGLYLVGCAPLRDYARRFGFLSAVPFALPVDTSRIAPCDSAFALAELASGFNQQTTLSPLLGALIAGAIADDGRMMRPTVVDSIADPGARGATIRAEPAVWSTPIKPQTAANLRTMMVKVAQYGTAHASFRYLRNSFRFRETQYGGKTGSVDQDSLGRVDWFVGFIRHATDPRQRLAVSVVTAHNDNWTVHSSFIAAELMRLYIREIQRCEEEEGSVAATGPDDAAGG